MTRKIEKLTTQEEDAMLVVWQQKGGTVKDFLGQMPEPRPPYTTLASVIKNLVRKGYVAAQKVGNTYYYTPAISEEEYKRCFLSDIVRNYFPTPTARWSLSSPKSKNSHKKNYKKSYAPFRKAKKYNLHGHELSHIPYRVATCHSSALHIVQSFVGK